MSVAVLLVTALVHHQQSGWLLAALGHQSDGSTSYIGVILDLVQAVVLSACLYATGAPWVSAWWRPLTVVLQRWPLVLPQAPSFLRRGGPLGRGCGKICEIVAAYVIWTEFFRQPAPFRFGSLPRSPWVWIVLVVFSAIVNLVLAGWSQYFSKGRGVHKGVHSLVQPTMSRSLTILEHVELLIMAAINAACEEVASRGFWMAEFYKVSSSNTIPNFCQALAFGVWHYHGGIPSGWIGVGLTFAYGFIMGLLALQFDGQLVVPVIAHTLADYFIFAIIARQKQFWSDKTS